MTNPKMKACPKCFDTRELAVYSYENGARHVECLKCNYLGPPSGSVRGAIKLHNERCDDGDYRTAPENQPENIR